MKKIIAIGLSPNVESEDVFAEVHQLITPWNYQEGKSVARLEKWFRDYFNTSHAVSFQNGRTALYAILSCLGIGQGDEVILQAFTCVVVPNAIIATGAKPIYVDINNSLTMDHIELEKKITQKTKAILVQHTFGIATDMDAIMKIAKKHTLLVIEDVAHSIGGEYKGKKLGTFGIASIFSLGRDKAFSSVFGGMAITQDKKLGEKLQEYQKQKGYPSHVWILQQLFHPIVFSIALPFYNFISLGKLLIIFFQKIHWLSFPVSLSEKKGVFHGDSVKKYPNSLASLALLQLQKYKRYNERRQEIAEKYKKVCEELHYNFVNTNEPLLRFPVLIEDPHEILKYFKSEDQIYLGNWYWNVIDPKGSNYNAIQYIMGSCPKAEAVTQKIINLPTYPTMSDDDVDRVITVLKKYYDRN